MRISQDVSPTPPTRQPERLAYAVDPGHASARFKVRHLMVSSVRGELGDVTGEVVLDEHDPARSSVSARIDATAVDTRHAERDAHLRSADFLDVARHPWIIFRSTAVRPLAPGRLAVEGELTLRGVTGRVVLEVELSEEIRDPWGNLKRGVAARATLRRKDFGVSWNALMDGGGVVVGEDVEVTIDAELVRQGSRD